MNKVCGNCVHYPVCYETRSVGANDPCRIGDYGFFRAKAKDPLPTVKALALLWRLADAAEVYSADQSMALNPHLGRVQLITVTEGEELNAALKAVYAEIGNARAG